MVEAQVSIQIQCAIAGQTVVHRAVDDCFTEGGVLTAVGTVAVAIAGTDGTPYRDGLLQLEIVVGIKTEIILSAPRLRTADDISSRCKAFVRGATQVVVVAPFKGGIHIRFPHLVFILRLDMQACLLSGSQSLRHIAGRPVAFCSRAMRLVHIVGVAKDADA